MTSGTLIELVEIGPRLSGLWVLPDTNHDLNGNYSTKILRDYIEISSNLYRQLIAWSEMEVQHKTVYATKLIKTNEHLAFRYPQSTTKEIIKSSSDILTLSSTSVDIKKRTSRMRTVQSTTVKNSSMSMLLQ